jgi:hypothetical protein
MVWYKNGTPPRAPNDVLSRRFASASSCARGDLTEYASTQPRDGWCYVPCRVVLQAGGCTVCQISAHVAGSSKGQGCAAPSGVGVWACARVAWNARYISACKSAKFTGRRWVAALRGGKVWDAGQEKDPIKHRTRTQHTQGLVTLAPAGSTGASTTTFATCRQRPGVGGPRQRTQRLGVPIASLCTARG